MDTTLSVATSSKKAEKVPKVQKKSHEDDIFHRDSNSTSFVSHPHSLPIEPQGFCHMTFAQ